MDSKIADMARVDARSLPAGSSAHYSAYVGPPDQYDVMGAMQFRLACSLGLREHHKLLDFGCGSLRAGRIFIVYLNAGRYFGLEPNSWLVDQAISQELGGLDIVHAKKPIFNASADFDSRVFGEKFDFIMAQSIFSHTGMDLITKSLAGFHDSLVGTGLAMATFMTPEGASDFTGSGWVYPGCVEYREATIASLATEVGLTAMRIPWFHPRQDWFLFARDPSNLPSRAYADAHLTGRLFGSPDVKDEKPARTLP